MAQPHPHLTPRLIDVLQHAKRVAVLGVGSELRGDDMAGALVAQKLAAWCTETKHERMMAFDGATAPENLTGEINRFAPTHLVVVDAAHMRKSPGAVDLIPPESIGGVSFSTHTLPMPIIINYIIQATGCVPLVVGIEPQHKDVLQPPSDAVLTAVEEVVAAFQAAVPST